MKRFIKNNLKAVIAFIAGAIMFSGITYAATFNFASGDVEHTKSDGSKTNVKAALNDLYVKASQGNASAGDILTGKTALSNGTLIPGAMPYIGPVTYPRNGEVGYNSNEGYAWVHLPTGYYEPAQYDWAPEVRLTKDQVKALADATGITTDAHNQGIADVIANPEAYGIKIAKPHEVTLHAETTWIDGWAARAILYIDGNEVMSADDADDAEGGSRNNQSRTYYMALD